MSKATTVPPAAAVSSAPPKAGFREMSEAERAEFVGGTTAGPCKACFGNHPGPAHGPFCSAPGGVEAQRSGATVHCAGCGRIHELPLCSGNM
jgi:hypothetical protein